MPSPPRPQIRVALIGYGLAGWAFHAPLITTNPALSLEVIVTRDPERRERAARENPGAVIVDSADAVWHRAEELELVVIASPNRTHGPMALAALAAGLGVVVDKPFAVTADEARRMIAVAAQRNLFLSVYQNRRWDGDFMTVRRLISEGVLGELLRFDSRLDRWRPTLKGGWREQKDPGEAGGLLYDLGSHLIDQAMVLCGPVTSVYAELDRRRPGVVTDDDVFLALTHASGVRSHLVASVVVGLPGPRLHVLGSRAAYLKFGVDVQEEALRRGDRPDRADWGEEPAEHWGSLGSGGEAQRVRTERGNYPGFYDGVVLALRDNAPPPVNPNDAVRGLEVIEAAQRSAAEGRVVTVTPGR